MLVVNNDRHSDSVQVPTCSVTINIIYYLKYSFKYIVITSSECSYSYIIKTSFFQVDLEYPDHLHDAHRDFPLAPEKLIITREMLSDEMKEFLRVNNLPFVMFVI